MKRPDTIKKNNCTVSETIILNFGKSIFVELFYLNRFVVKMSLEHKDKLDIR